MASEYALNLKATLDTQQVQQELNRLKSTYLVGSEDGNSFSKGPAGSAHMQKIEVQLTKLNSAITGLQRAIEQLARQQGRQPSAPSNGLPNAKNFAPALAPTSNDNAVKSWLKSKDYARLSSHFGDAMKAAGLTSQETQVLHYLYGNGENFTHNLLKSGALGDSFSGEEYMQKVLDWSNRDNLQKALQAQLALQRRTMRLNRQFAALIGGLLLGGAGSYLTDFGYKKTGAVVSGVGEGITAAGGAAWGATMLGASSAAAGPIGIVVGLATAALAVSKSLIELEEAAKKAAEAQAKTAEALRSNAVGLSLDMYGMYQRQRAEEVQKLNNLPVAKERALYFKTELEKAKANFFNLGDPAEYEKKIREDAEKKKNSTVDDFYVQGSMQSGFTEVHFLRERTDEEKAEIDKAANEAIEAQLKKFAAAKRELQAAEANAQVWQEVADKLKEAKDAGDKLARAARQEEAVLRNALVRQSSDLKYGFKEAESIRSTQIFANDILNEKNGPLSAFNKLSEELDKLRALRKDLRTQAFSINRDMELNGRSKTSIELKDMARRRDYLLQRSDVLGERADILETALSNIDVSKLAQKPDLSHVTSLAQYGFNMGEKDNTVERMEKYYTKSINLQQQIKDKIQEGIKTEAVYSL